jgi:multiple sugar transport system permease protein
MIITGFKPFEETKQYPPTFFPQEITLENFIDGWNQGGGKGLRDSFIVAVGSSIISMVLGVPAAYSLARYQTGGDHLAFWILSIRMMPAVVPVISLFLLFQTLKLYDTHLGLIIIYGMFNAPFVVWIMKGFFEEIPVSLEEAAWVDGVSRIRAFFDIILPLSTPGLMASALFCFIFSWNEFLFALVLTIHKVLTFPRVIPFLMKYQEPQWGQISAMGLLSIIPVIFIAFLLQKYLVRGLTYGAVRG